MKELLARSCFVLLLVVAAQVTAGAGQAAACENIWDCLDGPSAYEIVEQHDAAQIGEAWGTAVHEWVVSTVERIVDWIMQVPTDTGPGGAGLDIGTPTLPGMQSWLDWD